MVVGSVGCPALRPGKSQVLSGFAAVSGASRRSRIR